MGDGTTINRSVPVTVVGLPSDVVALSAGARHTCARTATGTMWCWGYNGDGQLGDGTQTNRSTPVAVQGVPGGLTATTAGSYHTCALDASGAAWCWGYGGNGELGDGVVLANRKQVTPVAVSGLGSSVLVALTAGAYHTCGLTNEGKIWCWGYNADGQLGDGTKVNRSTPVAVVGLPPGSTVVLMDAGDYHTCALTSAGAAWCWGYNGTGGLGVGSVSPTKSATPLAVSGGLNFSALSAGNNYTCALTNVSNVDTVQCWGSNDYGQLGDGTKTQRTTPTAVSGLSASVSSISAGAIHTCVLTVAGAVQCWGRNLYGQLGDGTNVDRTTPVAVGGTLGQGAATFGLPNGGAASVIITGPSGCTIASPQITSVPPGGVPTPPGASFPLGVFRFNAAGAGCNGAALTVRVDYPSGRLASLQPRKYGPSAAGMSAAWFPHGVVAGDSVTYTVTDNGTGDNDPAVGLISDPFAPTLWVQATGQAHAIPTLSEWGVAVLSLVMIGACLGGLRRQRGPQGR